MKADTAETAYGGLKIRTISFQRTSFITVTLEYMTKKKCIQLSKMSLKKLSLLELWQVETEALKILQKTTSMQVE
jgi:hypothetical protein